MWHAAHVACLYLSPRMEPALMRQDKAPRATRTRQQRQRRAVHQADSKEAATRQAGKRAARLYLRGAGVRQESRSPHEASSGGTGPVELPGEANHGAVAEGTAQSKQSSGSRSCEKSESNAALVGQMGQTRWSRIIVASGHSLPANRSTGIPCNRDLIDARESFNGRE